MTMLPRVKRYPATICADLRTSQTPAEGGLLGCGLMKCPIDTRYGDYSFIHSKLSFSYFGYLREGVRIDYAYFRVSTAGSGDFYGAQLGLLSGPPPSDQSYDLDCLKAVNMTNIFGTTGHKKFACNVELPADIHLYVGWWVHFATTQPKFMAIGRDYGCGIVRKATTGTDDPFYPGGAIHVTEIADDSDQTGVDLILKYTSI